LNSKIRSAFALALALIMCLALTPLKAHALTESTNSTDETNNTSYTPAKLSVTAESMPAGVILHITPAVGGGAVEVPIGISNASFTDSASIDGYAVTDGGDVVGYRILRADKPGGEWTIIAECAKGTTYADVNVEAGTTYIYAVQEVYADGSLGEMSAETSAAAPEDLIGGDIKGEKNFIVMKIDDPLMYVGEEVQEVDPGRGTTPLIVDDRTMAPIRAIAEAMGGSAGWESTERKATVTANGHEVAMWIGKKDITADGEAEKMDVAPLIKNDRTFLPIRFVAENIEAPVAWIGSTQEIVIVFAVS